MYGLARLRRFNRDAVAHWWRQEYVSFVQDNPGCSMADVGRATGRQKHRLWHEINYLISSGILKSRKVRGRHRLFVAGATIDEAFDAALRP